MIARFHDAKAAIERGDKATGLAMLAAIIREDPAHEPAWIWIASTIDDPEKKRQCYQHVLALNPNNGAARSGMALLDKGQTETRKCPYCAETVKAEAIVCRFCGRDLKASPPVSSRPVYSAPSIQKKRTSGFGILIAVILGVVAGFVGLCLVVTLYTSSLSAPRSAVPPTVSIDPETAKARWGTVDIREFAKNPDRYNGSQFHYKGEVFNIQEDSSGAAIQVWVQVPGGSEFDREAVMVSWKGRTTNVFQGTTVEFWGYGLGSAEGTNAFGATIRQPLVSAEYLTYFR